LRSGFDRDGSGRRFRSRTRRGATPYEKQNRGISAKTLRDIPAPAVLLPELRLQLSRLFEPVLFVPLHAAVLR